MLRQSWRDQISERGQEEGIEGNEVLKHDKYGGVEGGTAQWGFR